VTVNVTDADGDDVTVTPSAPGGMTSLDGTQTIAGGNGSFTFNFIPNDVLAGATGTINFTADDGNGGTASIGANLLCAGVTLAVDTLYAIPTRPSVSVGSPVTILVAMGLPANPFEYLAGVRVAVDQASGFDYVDNSYNIGAVGGLIDDADGIWAGMSPSGGFLPPPDNFILRDDTGDGRWGIDFNVTPLGGHDITAAGALFNFQATFDTPGTYVLTFQQTDIVDRTYYFDDTQGTNYYWADITNDHPGVRNSITVVP
jgi:hypothetical protein